MITTMFDLYGLFVEGLFGNVIFAIVGLIAIFFVMMMFFRMSLLSASAIIILFMLCMLIGIFGSFLSMMIFAFSFIYFAMSIIPWIRGWIG